MNITLIYRACSLISRRRLYIDVNGYPNSSGDPNITTASSLTAAWDTEITENNENKWVEKNC